MTAITRPILYVEDDDNDVFIMRRAFQEAEITHPLMIAPDGRAAMDYLSGERAKSPWPCLMLLDLKMPLVSGFEVLEWMRRGPRRKFDALPVVVLTSSAHEEDMRRAYALGANAYLIKPASPPRLIAMAKSIREFWLTHNQQPFDGES